MLARVIWLTVGTSAVISSESPAVNAKLRSHRHLLGSLQTRQTSGREIAWSRPLGEVARTVVRPGIGVRAMPAGSAWASA